MNRYNKITGYLLIISAITLWFAWILMPDTGTSNTAHLLNMVKESRTKVLGSVVVQVISCLVYIIVIVRLSQATFSYKKSTITGIILLGIGTMGLCADAFFHLLAYFMTDDAVTVQADIVRVMELMQTTGMVFLLPLLLPFFIGSIILAIDLQQQKVISKTSMALFIAALFTGITVAIVSNDFQTRVPGMTLLIPGIFATGQAIIGVELIKPIRVLQ
jgi:hypothetical protein